MANMTIMGEMASPTPARRAGLVARHPLIAFFILANAISWAIWLPMLLAAQGLLDRPVSQYLHPLGGIGPMLAALIVTALTTGRAGLRDLVTRLTRWRVGIGWWFAAVLGPVGLFGLAAIISRLAGEPWPDLGQFGTNPEFPLLATPLYWLLVSLLGYGIGEQVGWRGFALPRMQARHSALAATLVLSLFWALWHLPLFGILDTYRSMGPAGILGWFLSIVTGAIVLTWLFNSTGGSLLLVAVFHGMVDIVFNTPASPLVASSIGALFTVVALLVLIIAGPANLSRSGKPIFAEPIITHAD